MAKPFRLRHLFVEQTQARTHLVTDRSRHTSGPPGAARPRDFEAETRPVMARGPVCIISIAHSSCRSERPEGILAPPVDYGFRDVSRKPPGKSGFTFGAAPPAGSFPANSTSPWLLPYEYPLRQAKTSPKIRISRNSRPRQAPAHPPVQHNAHGKRNSTSTSKIRNSARKCSIRH